MAGMACLGHVQGPGLRARAVFDPEFPVSSVGISSHTQYLTFFWLLIDFIPVITWPLVTATVDRSHTVTGSPQCAAFVLAPCVQNLGIPCLVWT